MSSGILEALTSAVGEELAELRGHLVTRLTAPARPEEQVARGTATLSSPDGVNMSLSAGALPGVVVPGTVLQVLSGPNAGARAAIRAIGGAGTTAVLQGAGVGGPVAAVSWEVLRPADTEVQVESTLKWQDAGDFFLGGIRHRYTGRTPASLTDLMHWDGEAWVPGVARRQEPGDVLTDYTRARTALDLLRRAFFVEYAGGEDLSVLGANHARPRPEALEDDAQYRAYLRAAMYGPFGTRLHLRQILDAVLGPGRWEMFEDFTHPTDDFARVYLRRTDEDPQDPAGRALLDGSVLRPATSGTTVTLPEAPRRVGGVTLAPDVSFRVVASGTGARTADGARLQAPPATFPARILRGDLLEVLDGPRAGERGRIAVNVSDAELTLGPVAGHAGAGLSGPSPAFQWRIVREVTDCRTLLPSADTALEWDGDPGTRAWEWQGTQAEAAGALLVSDPIFGERTALGSGVAGQTGWYRHPARITPESNATLELLVGPAPDTIDSAIDGLQNAFEIHDGERALAAGWFLVSASASALALIDAATGQALGRPVELPVFVEGYRSLTLIKRGRARVELRVNGALLASAPYAAFTPTAARELRVGCRSATSPSFINLRHLAWHIETETDYWAARSTVATVSAAPALAVGGLAGLAQAGDVGRVLWVRGGTRRNGAGGICNGGWVIEAVVDPNTVEVVGPTRPGASFRRGHGNRVFLPVDFALELPDALGHTLEILTGPHAGNYPIVRLLGEAFEDLGARIRGTTLDSLRVDADGLPAISGRSAVVEVAGAPQGGFVATDGEYDWRLVPAFAADAGLLAEISDRGTVAGPTLTLPQPLPLANPLPVLAIAYSTVDSAHAEAESDRNDPATPRWPFYLYDAWGRLRPVLLGEVAEGVLLDLDSLQRDLAGLHRVED